MVQIGSWVPVKNCRDKRLSTPLVALGMIPRAVGAPSSIPHTSVEATAGFSHASSIWSDRARTIRDCVEVVLEIAALDNYRRLLPRTSLPLVTEAWIRVNNAVETTCIQQLRVPTRSVVSSAYSTGRVRR